MRSSEPILLLCLTFFLTACASTQTPPPPEKVQVEVTRIVQVTTAPQIVEVTREIQLPVSVEVTVTPTPGLADDCFATAQTQVELNGCTALYYEWAAEELKAVIAAITALDIPEAEKQELNTMQQEWQANMERDCAYFYGRVITGENGNSGYRNGSMAPMLLANCKADATMYRVGQLEGAYFPEGR